MVYGSFANCRVRTANWISVVTICSLISHLSGNNVVTRQISPTMNKDGQIHLLTTIAVIRHKYIRVLCGLSYPLCFFGFYFSLFILKQLIGILHCSAFNGKDSEIENLSHALVNHDKMSFLKEKKSFFFFFPLNSLVFFGYSDRLHARKINFRLPEQCCNRPETTKINLKSKFFFVRYLFSITISAIIIMLIVFLAFCSSLCQNDLRHSTPPPPQIPIFPPLEHIFTAAKNH